MQTNYSLINYNIHHILTIQGLPSNYIRNPVMLCQATKFTVPIRFYPGSKPTFIITEKFARRILFTFYHGDIYRGLHFEAKNRLPNEQTMIYNFREYTGLYKNKDSCYEGIRTLWKNRGISPIDTNVLKNNDNIFPHLSILAEFLRATYMPPNDIIDKIINEKDTKINVSAQSDDKKREILTKQQKIADAIKERDNVLLLFHTFTEKRKSDNILDQEILGKISTYLDKRGSILALSQEEHKMYISLKQIFEEVYLSRDKFIPCLEKKNNLYNFMQNLTLDNNIFRKEPIIYCNEQEYLTTIDTIKNIILLVQSKQPLTGDDLITLAYHAECIKIDEQGNPKISPQAYKYIYGKSNPLNLKYSNEKPDIQQILTALRERRYIIRAESLNSSEDKTVKMAPVLHKTLIIFLADGTVLETSMLTSTDGKDTTLDIGYQEINPNSYNILNKEEYFYIFPHFIKATLSETLRLDLLAQGFLQGKNLHDEHVEKMIFEFFEKRVDSWANNFIIESFEITDEILLNLTLAFFTQKLDSIEEQYQEYLTLTENYTEKQLKEFAQKRLKDKESQIEEATDAQYWSSLSSDGKLLFRCINQCEHIETQESLVIQNREKKKEAEEALRKHNESRPKEKTLLTKEQRMEKLKKMREEQQDSAQSEQQIFSMVKK